MTKYEKKLDHKVKFKTSSRGFSMLEFIVIVLFVMMAASIIVPKLSS